MAGFFQDTLYQASSNDKTILPPVNPVTPATASTIPDSGTVSPSLNPGVTASMIGGVASHASATAPKVTATGTGVITDSSGKINAGVGTLAQTPQQLEAAGILKPGSAALITGLVQRGANVESAMTNNLFTGMPGAETLEAYIKNVKAQTSAKVINFQQAQTAMTMTGAITGKEQPGLIAGIINAATQVGVEATATYLQNSSNTKVSSTVVPEPPQSANSAYNTFKNVNTQRNAGSLATGIGSAF